MELPREKSGDHVMFDKTPWTWDWKTLEATSNQKEYKDSEFASSSQWIEKLFEFES